jgi:HAE1 family hydrophobic/amphiphilic exporter-1
MAEAMGAGKVLMVNVTGDDLDEVSSATQELFDQLKEMENDGSLTGLESTLVVGGAVPEITFDPDKITPEIKMEWASMRYGYPLPGQEFLPTPQVQIGDENFDILIPGIAEGITEDQLQGLRIGAEKPVPLGDLIIGEAEWGPAFYHRADWNYSGMVTATIIQEDVGAVNRAVQDKFSPIEADYPEVSIEIGGIAEQMQSTFRDMGIAMLIAIVIAYLVVAVSLRSWLNPLIIMVSLPLASIGALLALLISGHTIGASALMGILMLVGIVLTNAIVLLTFVEQLKKQGMSVHDALMEGGLVRLRPILMTALTTIIALIPLSLGLTAGVVMAAELAVVVIGGLFASTLLTLLVIPVIYSLVKGKQK